MADDPPSSSNVNLDDQRLEDAETRATREELRHSHISDNGNSTTQAPLSILSNTRNQDGQGEDDDMKLRSGKEFNLPAPTSVQRKKTPDLSPPENLSRDNAGERKVSSPKKKRAHDEVETHKDSEGQGSNGTDSDGWVMVDEGDTNKSRSEPQKKRARDETSPPAELHQSIATTTSDAPKVDFPGKDSQQPQTSPSKFADSGFAKLAASSSSPFAAIGAQKSVFGGASAAAPSPFASFGAPASTAASTSTPLSPPKLSFGSKDASAPSPFAAMNGAKPATGGFGSGFGGGSPFSSALGGAGPRTGNFASPGQPPIIKSDKPAKPFGAPDSDAEDESDDDGDDDDEEAGAGGEADAEKEKDETASTHESTPAVGEDEKKGKFKRVAVDDGEAGETTIVQVRARMYYLDKTPNADNTGQVGWRERGVGNLRINVPEDSVTVDPETGAVDPKSFDPAVLKDSTADNPKLVRLVMRQDSTLRVILNTVMVAGMDFQLKEGFKTWSVLFTAIEGDDGQYVPITMKMSAQNAGAFCDKVEMIKKKLKEQAAKDEKDKA
ncbi:DEAD/DEAH box helicase [Diaporthe amygdali]|uniref:DEAD/DEAH box helicase n=1 Tax=Phomopsis amygdali TaxID=1214568 RepID=UPI0022FE230C|nr:DEAD/DEAH box helicase [Diaporthe amygdali]KAJ0117992.1 DEAD/DEAH box helicase [Diaporthe amygdali]